MSFDAILHIVGFAFVIAIWLAVLLGIGQLCRALRGLLQEDAAERHTTPAHRTFTVESAPRTA